VSDGGPPRFFHPEEAAPGAAIALSAEETEHAAQSLRLKPGDPVELVDGAGHVTRASVTVARRREFAVAVIDRTFVPKPDRPPLVMAVGLLKGARFETALEKLTELGADVLVPLATRYAEAQPKGEAKPERWRRLLVAAMKQSRRAWLPELREPMSPAALLAAGGFGRLFVAHPVEPAGGPESPGPPPSSHSPELLAVGPEGGWSPEELDLFERQDATFISLGHNRLRGETAAIALLAWRLATLGALGTAGRAHHGY
jgi:16S rRNA (uracil1498-N3)-methyltransferase